MIKIIKYGNCEYADDQGVYRDNPDYDVTQIGVNIGTACSHASIYTVKALRLSKYDVWETATETYMSKFSKQDIHHYVNITVYKTAMVFLHDKVIDVKEQEKALGGGL